MGGLILFIGAIFSAILGLAIFLAYFVLALYLVFIVASVAIFYYFGVAWGLAWLGAWWLGAYLINKADTK